MPTQAFDELNRFLLADYSSARPFASFLPGVAGPDGIPLWVFYVNRGQGIAAFGVRSKEHPIMEFQPANKAYQSTPTLGFRTFLKLDGELYEPFRLHPLNGAKRQMAIGMNDLELQERDEARGVQVNVLYFTLPHEDFAGLVRQVTIKNISSKPLAIETLDGLPQLIPFGATDGLIKHISRTIEAWMEVFNLAEQVPFFRLRASPGDTAEVQTIEAGNFAVAALEQNGRLSLLPPIVDPTVVFETDTSLALPAGFARRDVATLLKQKQIAVGRTPCAFFGAALTLAPGESITMSSIYGHTSRVERLAEVRERILKPGYLAQRREQANALVQKLTDVIATKSASPMFDAYARQTFLDNVLRGGWPLTWGDEQRATVYHIYSRKHGDLERDYNAFTLADEPYSQGNGNFRDVNQNRRCDVLFNPRVGDFNARAFVSFVQADGYNPLIIQGSTFTLPAKKRAAVLALAKNPAKLESLFDKSFTPGSVVKFIADRRVELKVPVTQFVDAVMAAAEQHLEASFGEGYWTDHWTYNLDLIETFLSVYPDRKEALLFGEPNLPFYESPAVVQPRARRYVLANGQPRQFNAIVEDKEKEKRIHSRTSEANWLRTHHGNGAVYRTTLFVKLVSLALNKFSTLDPSGLGLEMEGGRPGWYDALNGLPGLFGSSVPEIYELLRFVRFLNDAIEGRQGEFQLPTEMHTLMREIVRHLDEYNASTSSERDFRYWDAVAAARENYLASVRLGLSGKTETVSLADLAGILAKLSAKLEAGIERGLALNNQVPPTYFMHVVEEYELVTDADGEPACDPKGRQHIRPLRFKPVALPLFLEGPVRAYKVLRSPEEARALHARVKASALYDTKLKMYKVNASLAELPPDIGRAQAFPPGWLENESIWLHMEYKYLLEMLRAGLYKEFFEEFRNTAVPFLDPKTYGRSPLENSSFIVSSAYPDASLHGAGFVARLSGSTAEFLSIWSIMMAGKQPFVQRDGELQLALRPVLPSWLFTDDGRVTFNFLGNCEVTYHNPARADTFADGMHIKRIELHGKDGKRTQIKGDVIPAPHAQHVREGTVTKIDVFYQ